MNQAELFEAQILENIRTMSNDCASKDFAAQYRIIQYDFACNFKDLCRPVIQEPNDMYELPLCIREQHDNSRVGISRSSQDI
jgi:hypothetical protein